MISIIACALLIGTLPELTAIGSPFGRRGDLSDLKTAPRNNIITIYYLRRRLKLDERQARTSIRCPYTLSLFIRHITLYIYIYIR